MTTVDHDRIVDVAGLMATLDERRTAYAAARPFPHTVIDDLLRPEAFAAAISTRSGLGGPQWTNYLHVNERKYGNTHPDSWPQAMVDVADALMSDEFVAFLGALTGIDGLRADPSFDGGGLHCTVPGGFLNVHADFTAHHTEPGWRRRVNLLLYLNDDWDPDYGGELELWDESVRHREVSIAPVGNRAVVFNTTSTAFHGHPEPLRAPDGVERRSLALYYFTVEAHAPARSTDYRARPGDGARAVLIWADKQALRVYDVLKRRLHLSDDAVSVALGRLSRRAARVRSVVSRSDR